ncbi:hypothetical protein FACS18948_1460 [Clostridia bacterium]|nr:hypothetical protein FACS18948_1460 [Clostridia bacterium]
MGKSIRNFIIHDGYMHLPIHPDAVKHYVCVSVDGTQIHELHLGLSAKPEFYCAMELNAFHGRAVTLSIDDDAAYLLDGIVQGGPPTVDNPLYPDLYHETLRPAYHFSSRRGWLNDPNGLFYDSNNYHLYYQHNPYGIQHGGVNVHWGHAISPDAVQWMELDDGIKPPTRAYHIASGSAIIDHNGAAGFGAGVVIAAYTALGSVDFNRNPPGEGPSFGQFLAYSLDGGNTFTQFPDNPRIKTEDGKSWRDPRLFALDDGTFAIAVYETNERGNCVSFYHSENLLDWIQTSRADDLFECPDLFPLTVQETGERLWVLYGADGMYRIGTFESGVFTQTEPPQPLDYGDNTYAGQTWSGREDKDARDGRLHISWVRGMGPNNVWNTSMGYEGMPFSQCMSVSCLLTLHKTAEGYRLFRTPNPALNALHTGERISEATANEAHIFLRDPEDILLDIKSDTPVQFELDGIQLAYDPATRMVTFNNKRTVRIRKTDALRIRLLIDRTTTELFINDEVSATYGLNTTGKALSVRSEGGQIDWSRQAMRSIWP